MFRVCRDRANRVRELTQKWNAYGYHGKTHSMFDRWVGLESKYHKTRRASLSIRPRLSSSSLLHEISIG